MFTLLEILKKVKPTHEESLNRDLRLQKRFTHGFSITASPSGARTDIEKTPTIWSNAPKSY
jgi:hypothetical protein